jgi:myosin V
MEQRVEEATGMKERESAKKAVEEALVQERGKIILLTNEVQELKVLFPESIYELCRNLCCIVI